MAGLGTLEANVKHRAGRRWYRTGIKSVVYIGCAWFEGRRRRSGVCLRCSQLTALCFTGNGLKPFSWRVGGTVISSSGPSNCILGDGLRVASRPPSSCALNSSIFCGGLFGLLWLALSLLLSKRTNMINWHPAVCLFSTTIGPSIEKR